VNGRLSTVHSEQHSSKLVCWQKFDILNTECDADCDTDRIDLDCLKTFVKFHFCATN